MRRLLFSASLLLCIGCSSHKTDGAASESIESVAPPTETVQVEETEESNSEIRQAEKVAPTRPETKVEEEVTEPAVKKEAPKHQSYDQSKIDSIKQAKQKGKK